MEIFAADAVSYEIDLRSLSLSLRQHIVEAVG